MDPLVTLPVTSAFSVVTMTFMLVAALLLCSMGSAIGMISGVVSLRTFFAELLALVMMKTGNVSSP